MENIPDMTSDYLEDEGLSPLTLGPVIEMVGILLPKIAASQKSLS